jgi:hypothetical protein
MAAIITSEEELSLTPREEGELYRVLTAAILI